MKTKKLDTLEKYTTVAVRAKISVEVEQKKRLGAWGRRVLVLDGTTLYAYKTKGDGGSVGAWAIAGADVHVRRGNDSNRDDGRHILVIVRPSLYKLVFGFSTVYEQARMIQALSTSGATVTGLDAIMLLKNLRKQQEQEQKEQEERERAQIAQTSSGAKNGEGISADQGQERLTNGEQPKNDTGNAEIEETQEIDESIYDQGIVTNPLYAFAADLKREKEDLLDGVLSSISPSIGTGAASDSEASHFLQGVSPNKDSEDKVNPVPKPPRASLSEGSPIIQSVIPDGSGSDTSISKKEEEASCQQSVLTSDGVQSYLPCNRIPEVVVTDESTQNEDSSSEITNSEKLDEDTVTETTHSSSHDSSDDDTECEGLYEVNPDPEESPDLRRTETEDFESNYVELVSKMKLERGLSIESNSGGPILEADSPQGMRKLLGDSPVSDESIKSPSPDSELCDKASNGFYSDRKYNEEKYTLKDSNDTTVTEDKLSDNDEKFEQLYQELSSNESYKKQNGHLINNNLINVKEKETQSQTISSDKQTSPQEEDKKLLNGKSDSNNATTDEDKEPPIEERSNDEAKEDENNTDGEPLKRVSSIIKKKGSSPTGKSKKVQFNLDATSIDGKGPDSPSSSSESLTKKKADGSPTSPVKKKGIFSNIFSSSSSKKSEGVPPKDEAANKKAPSAKNVDNVNKKDPPSPKMDVVSKKEPVTKVDTIKKEPLTKVDTNKKEPLTKVDTNKKEPLAKVDTNKKDPPSPKMDKGSSVKKAPTTPPSQVKRQATVDLNAPLVISGSVDMGGSISGKVSPRRIEIRDGHVLAFMPKATVPTSRLSLVGLSVTPLMGGHHPNALSLTRANRCMMVIKLPSREVMMRWINVLSDEVIRLTPENQRTGLILYPSPKKKEENEKKETPEKDEPETKQISVNGHADAQTIKDPHKNTDLGVKTQSGNETAANVDKDAVPVDEDTSDGWLRRKKQTPVEEFEMAEIKKRESVDTSSRAVIKQGRPKSLQTSEEPVKEDKENEKVRRINKLNIQEIWKEHKDTSETLNMNSQNRRLSLENRQHPPLRRLSGQDHITKIKKDGTDIGSFPSPKNSSNRDSYVNGHPPLVRLSNQSRILSASESNLRNSGELRPRATNNLHRFGSEITLIEKPRKDVNDKLSNSTNDVSNVLVSSRIIRNQSNISKGIQQKESPNGMSPTSSPSHNRYKKSVSYEPRKVEIIESEKSGSQELNKFEEEQWYEDDKPKPSQPVEPSQEDLPGITWSVAATREKFELLCSVSGENKSGKLTTKTPISRKKSIKKRRSIESGSGRRPNSRWSSRSSSQGTNSIDLPNSPSPLPSNTQHSSVSDRTISDKNTSSTDKGQDAKLPPVRDLRRNFERDVTDSPESFLTNSSSFDSLSDNSIYNTTNNHVPATKDSPSPSKSLLQRTQNMLQTANSPCSSPEPEFITSKLINSRPRRNVTDEDRGVVSRSLINQVNPDKDSEVVICWRGPYIAQDSDSAQNTDQSEEKSQNDWKERKEAEQAVLSNISNAFLAKRRLLAREVATARIQEKLSALEETIWDIQASMAELDKQPSHINAKSTSNWKTLERSLNAAEEDMAYWTSRLGQTQKEAEQAREKLAAALVTGLSQYSSGEAIQPKQRQQLLRKFTKGSFSDHPQEEDDEEEEEVGDHNGNDVESFA